MSTQLLMQCALHLAEQQLGLAWPNPAVGAIIVKNSKIIGEGATAKGGRPHAETIALQQAGENAHEATMYVTLEPCAHHGKTPPCVDAIIAAGISKVVIACEDLDSRTKGKGITMLRQAGIEVEIGLCEAEAKHLNRGFFSRIQKHRPHVMLKLATSSDGHILLGNGKTQWVTGEASRKLVHQYRAHYDAVLTTSNTVKADNPLLTCRIPGLGQRSPIRIILDRQLEIAPSSQLVQTAKDVPVWIITESRKAFYNPGVTVFRRNVAALGEVMHLLAEKGLTRVMVEAGAQLPVKLLEADLVDEICWFRSPNIIKTGLASTAQPALKHLESWNIQQTEHLGEDTLEIYTKP